ncbi:MAG: hypothetical protein R2817_00665 [Flavobacteriales bacterium]
MKRLLPSIVAVLLVTRPATLNSCGPDYTTGEDFRFWLLQPELAASRPLHAFFFTTEVLYATDYDEITSLPYAANIAEWQAVVGPSVPADAIEAILYDMEPADYFAQEQELFRSNAFLRRLAQLKNGWPAYIAYAKRCEQLVNSEDPWGFIAHDGDGIRNAWNRGVEQLRKARQPALQARLAFQLVRLAHHGHDAERPALEAQRVYDRHLAPLRGKSWMEASAAFYLAAMLPNPARDLAFAEIFDRAPDKQFRMVQLFVSREVEHYLPLAKDDRQRAMLLVMRDLQHPGRALEDLERIAAWDPSNEHLPLLLTREVNKLEDWLLTPAVTEYDAAIRMWTEGEEGVSYEAVLRTDLDYLGRVQEFIRRIAPQADPEDRPLLNLLDGHLSFVAGRFPSCEHLLERLVDHPAAAPLVKLQARIDLLLCKVMSSNTLVERTQQDILALVELVNTEPELFPYRRIVLGQLHLYLGQKLIERGEVAEGVFLLARSERHFGNMITWQGKNARHVAFEKAAPADHDRMIALLDKPEKTAFERYLTATDERPADREPTEETFHRNELTREKLLDYKGMWYLREDRLEEAAAAYRQIPDAFWGNYPYDLFADDDPFVVNIEDPHNYSHTDSARYTRRTIVERMIALKNEAARDPKKRALNHYLLGNAYYNMSWHGKYWGLSRIAWSMWEMDQWRDREDSGPGDDDYFGNKRALDQYIQAIEHAKEPVLKALAVRMAGECERNWLDYAGEGGLDEWQNPWAEQLTDGKSREAYRRIEECISYSDYVRRYK